MLVIAEELSSSQGNMTLSKLKVQKDHKKVNIKLVKKILMWRILLSSYILIQAIYEELQCSQGSAMTIPKNVFINNFVKCYFSLDFYQFTLH